jgi:hypothetical protein
MSFTHEILPSRPLTLHLYAEGEGHPDYHRGPPLASATYVPDHLRWCVELSPTLGVGIRNFTIGASISRQDVLDLLELVVLGAQTRPTPSVPEYCPGPDDPRCKMQCTLEGAGEEHSSKGAKIKDPDCFR